MPETDLAVDMLTAVARGEWAVHRFDSGDAIESFRRVLRAAARHHQLKIHIALFDDHLLAIALQDSDLWHETAATIRARISVVG